MFKTLLLTLAFVIAIPAPLFAQGDDDDSAVAEPDVMGDLGGVLDAAGELKGVAKGDKQALALGILVLLSAIIKLLGSALAKWGGAIFKKAKAQRIFAVVLGLVAGVVTMVITGLQGEVDWMTAVMAFLSGPGAMGLHDLSRLVVKKKEE